MDFNNLLAFKGIESNQITSDEIAVEMEKFVSELPSGSPHLRYLRITSSLPRNFKLTFGQKSCLRSCLDLIVEKLFRSSIEMPVDTENDEGSQNVVTSQAETRRRRAGEQEIVIKEVDLLNIQNIWDSKLSGILYKQNLIHNDFPIISSSTEAYPYKFKIQCPKCKILLTLTISKDVVRGKAKQPHYRFSSFIKHVVACMKK